MSFRARIAAVLLAAVALVAACGDSSTSSEATTSTSTTEAGQDTSTTAASDTTVEVVVADGKPVGGVQEIEVKRGLTVRLRVVADVTNEVHVHGYDIHGDVTPETPAVIVFTADLSGKFEIELEKGGLLIAELTVS